MKKQKNNKKCKFLNKKYLMSFILTGLTTITPFLLTGCGEMGPQGPQGEKGNAGATWYSGESEPGNNVGVVGDFYFETIDGDIWQYQNSGWVKISNIKGPAGNEGEKGPEGDVGPEGTAGTKWFSGLGDPLQISEAEEGDFYFDTIKGKVWRFISGSWSSIADLTGLPGTNGATWYSGENVPNISAKEGDFYFQTNNKTVWKYINAQWVEIANTSGNDGSMWYTGEGNPSILDAKQNDFYFDSLSGSVWSFKNGSWVYLINLLGEKGETGTSGQDGISWHLGEGNPLVTNAKEGDFYFDSVSGKVWNFKQNTWIFLLNLTGEKGEQGEAGQDGITWYTGEGDPLLTNAKEGDFYFDSLTGNVWRNNGSFWNFSLNLIGQKGDQGVPGANGSIWYTGEGDPSIDANTNDFYFDSLTGAVWKYESNSWIFTINLTGIQGVQGETGPQGPSGKDGSVWYSGEGDPTISAKDNDFYIDSLYGKVWKYVENEWVYLLNLIGPGGEKGEQGSVWYSGEGDPTISAREGDFYLDTENGKVWKFESNAWNNISNIRGPEGEKGDTPSIFINSEGYWVVNGIVTDVNAYGTGQVGDVLVSSKLQPLDLKGKKITIFGDSISTGHVGVSKNNSYVSLLEKNLGMVVTNKSTSGVTLCDGVVDGQGNPRNSKLQDVANYDEETDYILIALGTNDWNLSEASQLELGTLGSNNTKTIYGAVNQYARILSEKYKNTSTKIFFATPIIQSTKGWSTTIENSKGYNFRDLCNAIIETAEFYDIPTFDMNRLSGIYYNSESDNNVTGNIVTMYDGLHPNDLGHAKIANSLTNFLLENYSYENIYDTRSLTLKTGASTTNIRLMVDGEYVLTEPKLVNKVFAYWLDEKGTVYLAGETIKLSTNITLTAVYMADTNPVVKIINSNNGKSTHGNISVPEGKTVLEAEPTFAVSNSLGLVPTFYTDINYQHEVDIETYIITKDTKLYVYWETNPDYFTYNSNGDTLIGLSSIEGNPFNSNKAKEITTIILPRYSKVGDSKVKITSVDCGTTTSSFLNSVPSNLTGLQKFIIPEGYRRIIGYFMARRAMSTLPTNAVGFDVHIPASLTELGEMAFVNVPVKRFIVSENNSIYTCDSNFIMFRNDGIVLFKVPAMANITNYVVPSKVVRIWGGAFYGNKIIKSLTFTGGLTYSIPGNAMEGMSSLTSLTFDFSIVDTSVVSRNTFKLSIMDYDWDLCNVGSSIYVKDEQSKTNLQNILLYGKTNPILEGENADIAITNDTFYTSANVDKLINKIKVK